MKINEIKHNHSLTDLLKVLLFSILMLLPFIDVFVRCGYVMFNKNAYQSYYGETINEETYEFIDNVTSLQTNESYIFQNSSLNTTLGEYQGNQIEGFIFDLQEILLNETSLDLSNCNKITYLTSQDGVRVSTRFYNNETLIGYSYNAYKIKAVFISNNITTNADRTAYNNILSNGYFIEQITYNKNSYLDNVFEYSVSQLEESNLYNWTTQTAIYSVVSQMTAQLGITGNIIPIILCYWFFITIIYIILDIVIKLFTILTHFIGSKTSS